MGISLSGLTESSTGNLTISAGSGNDVLIGNGSTVLAVDGGVGSGRVTIGDFGDEQTAEGLLYLNPNTVTVGANRTYSYLYMSNNNVITIPSGTSGLVTAINIEIPNITATGTVTNTATIRIAGAMTEGSNNYALWVDDGAVRFDDRTFSIGGIAYEFPANNGSANEALVTDGSGNLSWSSVSNAATSTTVVVTDNEATNENNLIPFVADAATATGNHGLEMDGDFTYSPNTGRLTATQLAGTLQTAAQGNITSVGTLSSLTTSGDVTVGDDLLLTDGKFVRWGGGSGDTRIYGHAGNNLITFVTAGAESFRITGGATPTMTFAGSVDITTSSGNLTLAPGGSYVISTKSMEIDVASANILSLRDGSNTDVVTFDSRVAASGQYAPGRIVSLPDTINLTTGAGSNAMNKAFGSAFKPGVLTFTATNGTSTWAEGPATVYIAGPPVAGSNVAFTAGGLALWVDAGVSRFDGDILLDGDLDFTGPQEITTSSGDLTLNPAGDVRIGSTEQLFWTDGTREGYLSFSGGNSSVIVGANSNHALEFRTNNVQRMFLDTSGTALFQGRIKVGQGAGASYQHLHTDDSTLRWEMGYDSPSGVAAGFYVYSGGTSRYILHEDGSDLLLLHQGTGNVGIGGGSSNPNTKLEITGAHTSGYGLLHLDSTDSAWMSLDSAGSSNDSGIYFAEAGTNQADIRHDASENELSFQIPAGTARMVIQSDGKVGIGTASPDHELHVENTASNSTPTIKIENDTIGYRFQINGSDADKFQLLDTTGFDTFLQFNPATKDVGIGVANKDVGIGTATPGATLDIVSNGASGAALRVYNSDSTNPYGMLVDNTAADASDLYYIADFRASGSSKFIVLNNGNIGIGASVPANKLTITDGATPYTSANYLLQVKRNATNSNNDTSRAAIMLANNSNGFTLAYGGTTDRFRILDGSATERFTILNGGNVGIGTDAPDQILHVKKSNAYLYLESTESSNADGYRGSEVSFIGTDGARASMAGIRGEHYGTSTDHAGQLQFFTTSGNGINGSLNASSNGVQRMTINSSGNVAIGTTDIEAWRSVTTAVQFGGTAAIEAHTGQASGNTLNIMQGAYNDGSWKYKISGRASLYQHYQGEHYWYTSSASGSANATVSWVEAMVLRTSGALDLSDNDLLNVGNAASEWASGALLVHAPASGNHAKLELNMIGGGSGDAIIRFQETGTSKFTIGLDDTDTKFKISASGDLGNSDRLIIDASGNVGIGVGTPFVVLASGDINLNNNDLTNVGNSDSDWTNGILMVASTGISRIRVWADSDNNADANAWVNFGYGGTSGAPDRSWATGVHSSGKFVISTRTSNWADSSDTNMLAIDTSGHLSTTTASAISSLNTTGSTGSGSGTVLYGTVIYKRSFETNVADTSSTSNYWVLSKFRVSRSGAVHIHWQANIQSGAYYFAWRLLKNTTANMYQEATDGTTAASGDYRNITGPSTGNSVHSYRHFAANITGLVPGDTISIALVSSTGGGVPTSGSSQPLRLKDVRVYGASPESAFMTNSGYWNQELIIGADVGGSSNLGDTPTRLFLSENEKNPNAWDSQTYGVGFVYNGGGSDASTWTNYGGGGTLVNSWGIVTHNNSEHGQYVIQGNRAGTTLFTHANVNVGIGASPSYKLHVEGGANTRSYTKSTTGDALITVDAANDAYISMARAGAAKWAFTNNYVTGTDNFSLYNYPNNINPLVVTAAGLVGIGATTVDTLLHLEATRPIIKLQDSSASGDAAMTYIAFVDSGGTERGWVGDGSPGNDDIYLSANTGDLRLLAANGDMYLYPNGDSWDDVYIGDGSALCRVHLNGTGAYSGLDWSEAGTWKWAAWYHSADNKLYFRRNASPDVNVMAFTDGSDEVTFYGTVKIAGGSPADGKVWTATDSNGTGNWETPSGGGSGTVSSGTTNRLAYYSGSTTVNDSGHLYVDESNNRLGIGVAPVAKFHVNGAIGTTPNLAYFFNSDMGDNSDTSLWIGKAKTTDQSMGIGFHYDTTAADSYAWLGLRHGDNPASGTAIVVKTGGKVGIGTIAPTLPLNIQYDATQALSIASDSSSSEYIALGATAGNAHIYAGSGASDSVGMLFYTALAGNEIHRLTIRNTGYIEPRVGGGNITGRYSYGQRNTGTNAEHKIRGPNGGYLLDEMGNDMYARITVVVTGTSTSQPFCLFEYYTNSDENAYTLTHLRGNSGSSSNRPYMGLNGKYPWWKMNHSSNYLCAITVEIHGGQGGTHWTGDNDYTSA